jgi:hypothetical protein
MSEGFALPTTITRSVQTVLVPGLIADAPLLLAIVQHTSATFGFDKYPTLAHVMLFACVVVTGSIFEGLGSFFEAHWDERLSKEMDIEGDWYAYLASKETPVGHRYLSRLVTTMYFELSMMFSVPIFFIGLCVLACLRFPECIFICTSIFFCAIFAAVSARYFHWQAKKTHKILCVTRQQLRRRLEPKTWWQNLWH